MNCSPSIAIALLLLALTSGTLLLYKTQKENLSIFFKVIAWFVIVVSLCSMICCTMRCVMHGCMRGQECREMGNCERGMGMGECGMHGGMNKRIVIMNGEGGGECEMMKGCCKERMECGQGKEECDEGKMDCCKKGGAHECEMGGEKKCDMKMEMKKDTVVVKKK